MYIHRAQNNAVLWYGGKEFEGIGGDYRWHADATGQGTLYDGSGPLARRIPTRMVKWSAQAVAQRKGIEHVFVEADYHCVLKGLQVLHHCDGLHPPSVRNVLGSFYSTRLRAAEFFS